MLDTVRHLLAFPLLMIATIAIVGNAIITVGLCGLVSTTRWFSWWAAFSDAWDVRFLRIPSFSVTGGFRR